MIKKIIIPLATLFTVLGNLMWINAGYYVNAADASAYRIQISPVKDAIEVLEPGAEYESHFKVKNIGTEDLEVAIFVTPYSVQGANYDANFNQETASTELSKWITVTPEAGIIAPGEELQVVYTINVPEGTHGGAQNAAVMVRATNTDDIDNNVAVQALRQVGYIIYSNVAGETIRSGSVLENSVPSFLFNPPIQAVALVENTGNIYTEATHKLQIFPLFSDEEVYTNEEDPESSVIFAGTKRYSNIEWLGAPQLGIFKVRSTVRIFDEESVTEKLVFLCPIWFLFVCILAIFVFIFSTIHHLRGRDREG